MYFLAVVKRLLSIASVLALAALLVIVAETPTSSQADPVLVEKYYKATNTKSTCGSASISASFLLRKEVPIASQGEVYAGLIDRASKEPEDYPVIEWVLSELGNKSSDFEWNEHLTKSLLANVRHSCSEVRGMMALVLAQKDLETYKAICQSYLEDSDEYVRRSAVIGIGKSGTGVELLKKYVQRHGNDIDRGESLRQAEAYLRPISSGKNAH